MPPDHQLTDAQVDEYDKVRKYFKDNPDEECVSLFLHSFGEGDLHGVYQLVEETMIAHESSKVISELLQSLKSEDKSVLRWSAEIAQNYTNNALLEPLIRLLNHSDLDVKESALLAIEQQGADVPMEALNRFVEVEGDVDLREIAKSIIER